MLYRLFFSFLALSALVNAGIDDPDNDQHPGNCKDPCGPKKCNAWAVDDHPCAAREIKNGVAVDPFRCGKPRCQETSCDKCGTKEDCIKDCQAYKQELVDLGYNMDSGFPNCNKVCGEFLPDGAEDFMCFIGTCYPQKNEATNKPECYELFKCQENYCSAAGKQDCYAKYNYVDPWGVSKGDPCKKTNCRRCGGQETCMDYCEDYKKKHPREEQVNCKAECAGIQGYKCIFTPGGAQPDEKGAEDGAAAGAGAGAGAAAEKKGGKKKKKQKKGGKKDNGETGSAKDEDALRAETSSMGVKEADLRAETDGSRKQHSKSSGISWGWPLGMGFLASLVLGEYLYRQQLAGQTHKRVE